MKDIFQEKIKGLDKYRWITIQDCSEEMEYLLEHFISTLKKERLKE